jgi:hypothetical protein
LGIEGVGGSRGAQEECEENHLRVPLGHHGSSFLFSPPSLSPPIVSHVSPALLLTDTSGNLARHQRPRSPGLAWHGSYSKEELKNGRVLMIDYVKKEKSREGMRKVAAEEIRDIDALHKVYLNPDRGEGAVLRVFHVQNAWWATKFLLKKFNISNSYHSLVETDFGDWVKTKKPERHAGKPVMNAKSWKTVHDPWRGVSRTMWGMDYLKQYKTKHPGIRRRECNDGKIMELNDYDEEGTVHLFFLFLSRLTTLQTIHAMHLMSTCRECPSMYNTRRLRQNRQVIPTLRTHI